MSIKSQPLAITTKGNGDAFLSEHHSSLAVGGGMPGQGYGCVLTTLPTDLSVSEDGKGNTTLTDVSNSLTYGGGKPGQGYGCVLTAYGFDQGATRDVGVLFLKETAKTLSNGTCPGHHNGVCVTAYGFKPRQSAKARSVGFEQDVFPTLEISQNSAVIYEKDIHKD